jgi:glycosyltransferase involved in cell wall biosynthesis
MNADAPISFYIPARNAARTLADCIRSVLAQTRPPDELFIVVDPRSTDDTARIAAGSGWPVLEQRGPTLGAARNEAIRAARHRWLASCDSDVVLESGWLARLAARRDQGDFAGIGGRTVENVRSLFDEWRALHMPHHWGEHALRNPFMLVSEVLFDRRALMAMGGYRDDLNYYEDSDLCQRIREAGYDLLYEPAAVASHQRSDSLLGLLGLRWKYSEYRQKPLMDRYDGLIRKCAVNREYALTTLSRSIARGRERLSYVSFLLFFHHMVLDLRSLLTRRPLIRFESRAEYERQLVERLIAVVAGHHPGLAEWIEFDLETLRCLATTAEPRDDTAPGWRLYLDRAAGAADSFCREVLRSLLPVIDASARVAHAQVDSTAMPPLETPPAADLAAALNELPLQPVVDEGFCQSIRRHWGMATRFETAGPVTAQERDVLGRKNNKATQNGDAPVLLAPHLEARVDPTGLFGEVDGTARRLVACYRPPGRFIPGLDVASASDLASAAAAAGWTIENFDTFVGATRLFLSYNA